MTTFATLSTTPDSVRCRGRRLPLTAREMVLLRTLVNNQASGARDLTRHDVLESAIDAAFPGSETPLSNVLQVMLSHIRKKLDAADAGVRIRCVRGIGYALEQTA